MLHRQRLISGFLGLIVSALSPAQSLGGGDFDGGISPISNGGAVGPGQIMYRWTVDVENRSNFSSQQTTVLPWTMDWTSWSPNVNITAYPLNYSTTKPKFRATLSVRFNYPGTTKRRFRFYPGLSMQGISYRGSNGFEYVAPGAADKSYLFSAGGTETKTFNIEMECSVPNFPLHQFQFRPYVVEDSRRVSILINGNPPSAFMVKKDILGPAAQVSSATWKGMSRLAVFQSWSVPVPITIENEDDVKVSYGLYMLPFPATAYNELVGKAIMTLESGNYTFNESLEGKSKAGPITSLSGSGVDISTLLKRPCLVGQTLAQYDAFKTIELNAKANYTRDNAEAKCRVQVETIPHLDKRDPLVASAEFRSYVADNLEVACESMQAGNVSVTSDNFTKTPGKDGTFLKRDQSNIPTYLGATLQLLASVIPSGGTQVLLSFFGILQPLVTPNVQTCNVALPSWDSKASNDKVIIEYSDPLSERLIRSIMTTNPDADIYPKIIFKYYTETRATGVATALDVWGPLGYVGRDITWAITQREPDNAEIKKFIIKYAGATS